MSPAVTRVGLVFLMNLALTAPAFARGSYDRSPIGHFTAAIVVLCLLGVLSLSIVESVKKEGFPENNARDVT